MTKEVKVEVISNGMQLNFIILYLFILELYFNNIFTKNKDSYNIF